MGTAPRSIAIAETSTGLGRFDRRGAGTDAERRAALWLAGQLRASGREAVIEPFWCRPNWALAHAWPVALGLAGSVVCTGAPVLGAALTLVALLALIADALLGASPGRRLTPERASQNVLAPPRVAPGQRVRVILTANYDAGRMGLVYRDRPRAAAARLRTVAGGLGPGWLGWLAIALLWLLVIAILRRQGGGVALAAAQLVPTVALVLALAALLELAGAGYGPGAGDNGSGVAVALALARALDAAPPRHLAVEVVLTGAGDGPGLGLGLHLRRHKRALTPAGTVVLGIAACAEGAPRWWCSDGPLLALAYFARLRELCGWVATEQPRLAAGAHRSRGNSPAFPARLARLPAIAIGCLDERGVAARSHQTSDTADRLQAAALEQALELGLRLLEALDAFLEGSGSTTAAV